MLLLIWIPPLTTLDVSGVINTNTKYTINYIAIAPPVGSIMAFTVASSPDGWLLCNGAEISRSTYSALLNVISTTFGNGNNSTTFNLPDYRGAFYVVLVHKAHIVVLH